MNRRIGMISSGVTLFCVALFALFMLIGMSFAAYAICIVLACGYVIMTSSFAAYSGKDTEAAKYAGLAFAVIYAVFVILVYFAQITTVAQNDLSMELTQLLDYQKFGLFFNYNLLGYGMLSISTFFIGLTISPEGREDKVLRTLLLIHGVFTVVIFIPLLGIFNADMVGGNIIGIAVLEIWCLYFIPICFLSYRHFKRKIN